MVRTTLRSLGFCLISAAVCLVPAAVAQRSGAKQAIEALEHCSAKERQSGCVRILKRKNPKDQLVRVKAQLRGSRIIWYEYNQRTGAARRLN